MTKELAFPLELDAFIAYQESGTGRELTANECEALAAWLPIINQAYMDGRKGDYAAVQDVLDILNHPLSESMERPALVQFLKSMRYWIACAWERGSTGGEEE